MTDELRTLVLYVLPVLVVIAVIVNVWHWVIA